MEEGEQQWKRTWQTGEGRGIYSEGQFIARSGQRGSIQECGNEKFSRAAVDAEEGSLQRTKNTWTHGTLDHFLSL